MLFGELIKRIKTLLVKTGSIQEADSLFLYLSQSISPPPSATLGDLVLNYGIDGKTLPIKYALIEAWGWRAKYNYEYNNA